MTVDIARMDSNAVAVLGGANDAMARLGQWVEAARNANRLVAPLIDTAFVPDAYKPKIDPRATPEQKAEARQMAINNATAAVLQGLTLGVDPLVALQQIYIIHGRPGMYAKFMVALIQAHGHEVWTEDLSDTRAVVCGRRRGSEHTERVTITMDMARKAKWTSNAKYTETPQDMLYARAAGRVCDRIASDVLKGITTVEAIQDEVYSTSAEVGPGTRTVVPRKRAAAPAIEATTVEEPSLDEAEPVSDPEEPTVAAPRPITQPQQRKLHALLREHDMSDREVALVWIAGVLEREIESTKDLSVDDAKAVIDALENLGDAEPALDGDDWPAVAGEGA
ncbi:MAG: hypothetical protein V4515_12640 [Chloroflexota bacterium]